MNDRCDGSETEVGSIMVVGVRYDSTLVPAGGGRRRVDRLEDSSGSGSCSQMLYRRVPDKVPLLLTEAQKERRREF